MPRVDFFRGPICRGPIWQRADSSSSLNNSFKKAFTLQHWLEVHMPPVKRQECKTCQRVFRRLFDVKRHSLKFHKKEMGSKLVVRDSKFFEDP